MTEERLKEIKYWIDLQRAYPILHDDGHLIEQKLELYNEVIRLREIIDKIKNKVNQYEAITGYYDSNYDGIEDIYSHDLQEDLLNILRGEDK